MDLLFSEWLFLFESKLNEDNFEQFRSLYIDPFINDVLTFAKTKSGWLDEKSKSDLERYKGSMDFYNELGWKYGKDEYGGKYSLGSGHPRLTEIINANLKNAAGNYFFSGEPNFEAYLNNAGKYNPANKDHAPVVSVADLLKFLFHKRLANATANLGRTGGIGQTGEKGGDLEGTMVGQHRSLAQAAATETTNSIVDCLRKFYQEQESVMGKRIAHDKDVLDQMLNNEDESDVLFLQNARLNLIYYVISKVFNLSDTIEDEHEGIKIQRQISALKDQLIKDYFSRKGNRVGTFVSDNVETFKRILSEDANLANYAAKLYGSIIYLLAINNMDRSQYATFTEQFVNNLPESLKTDLSVVNLKNLRGHFFAHRTKIMTLSTESIPPQTFDLQTPEGLIELIASYNFPAKGLPKIKAFLEPIFITKQTGLSKLDIKKCDLLIQSWKRIIGDL